MDKNDALLAVFSDSLAGHDPKTIRTYLSSLKGFATWLAQQPGGKPFRTELLTETAIEGYLDALAAKGRAPRTRSQALTVLRRFCDWAMTEGMLSRNPANRIARPTVIKTAPRELTEQQRYILKQRIEVEQSPRLTAIFALGYWAGLRISEIANLRYAACKINQRAGAITIIDGKGKKSRTLDLHNKARRALDDYLREPTDSRDARDPESEFLFTSQRAAWLRRQGRPDQLSARGIDYLWRKTKQQATREEWAYIHDITFHDLRHDFAHRARSAGWHLEEIAVYLGHQTNEGTPAIITTARYTLPSRKQLKQKLKLLGG
jgi:site-specific recombinase XerD